MDDLSSRQAAIDSLERYRELFSWNDGDRERAILSRVIKELQSMPSAQPEQRNGEWISFDERLPKIDINVLVNVCATDAPYKVVLMSASSAMEHYKKANINAWMPLPEPYAERIPDDKTPD